MMTVSGMCPNTVDSGHSTTMHMPRPGGGAVSIRQHLPPRLPNQIRSCRVSAHSVHLPDSLHDIMPVYSK